jgi:hypothetical protein
MGLCHRSILAQFGIAYQALVRPQSAIQRLGDIKTSDDQVEWIHSGVCTRCNEGRSPWASIPTATSTF